MKKKESKKADRIFDKSLAESIINECQNQTASIKDESKEEKNSQNRYLILLLSKENLIAGLGLQQVQH